MFNMNNVSKIYQTDVIQTHALKDFSLTIEKGEFVAITGPSGSGKSTFLNIAGLLENFDSGSYTIDGEQVTGLSDRQLSAIRNQKLGFIFQSFNLISDYSLYDNIDMPLRYRKWSKAKRHQHIMDALAAVGLQSRADYYPNQLSGGQQQRVAIARALAGNPSIILADEPTGNLDSTMAQQVMELLLKLNEQGVTILMVTHSPEQAQQAKRVVRIVDGQLCDSSVYQPILKEA